MSQTPATFASRAVDTSHGRWLVNGNGTVTDTQNSLTWMQAPWGLTWNGGGFTGEAVRLSWNEATKMFGKGVFAYKDRAQSSYAPEDWAATAYERGYTRGTRQVHFAGSSDWRLPTAAEWCTLQFDGQWSEGQHEVLFPAVSRGTAYLTASGKDTLFFFFASVVWKGWFGRPINDENPTIPYPILLVRG